MKALTWAAATCFLMATVGCGTIPSRNDVSQDTRESNPANKHVAHEASSQSTPESALALGLRYERSGNDRLAYGAYAEAVRKDPKSSVAHHRLAAVCDRLGNFDEAESHYQTALKLSPGNVDILNDLGYSYYLSAQPQQGERVLRQCLALKPNHARAHTNLGLVLGRQGREQESLVEFRRGGATEEQAAISLAFVRPQRRGNSTDSSVVTANREEPTLPDRQHVISTDKPQELPRDKHSQVQLSPPIQ